MEAQALGLHQLIDAIKEHMKSLNYSKSTLENLNIGWTNLKTYAESKGIEVFTTEFGLKFLWQRFQIKPSDKNLDRNKSRIRRSIEILDYFQQNGRIFKHRQTRLYTWPKQYHEVCEAFMNNIAVNQLRERTLHIYRVHLEQFTEHFVNKGIMSLQDIKADDVDSYFMSCKGYQKKTIARYCYIMKTFLQYAYKNGYTAANLAIYVPEVKGDNFSNLPSIYTEDEIKCLLAAVDRGNAQGKRDYAILLLAVQYGMRVGEITSLKLSNLDFEAKKITYVQNKTNNAMSFDILPNVGWTLIDYIKNARPKTDSKNVFVRLIAPYDEFSDICSLAHIIKKYLSRAGIKRTNDRHYGMHTIRHSLASRLLEQGKPLHIISQILGHAELNTTMVYTKIDIPQLSLCALEVPDVTK